MKIHRLERSYRASGRRSKMVRTIWLAFLWSACYLLPQVSSSESNEPTDLKLNSPPGTSTTLTSINHDLDPALPDAQLTTSTSANDQDDPDSLTGSQFATTTSPSSSTSEKIAGDENLLAFTTSNSLDELLDGSSTPTGTLELSSAEQQLSDSDTSSLFPGPTDLPPMRSLSDDNEDTDSIRGANRSKSGQAAKEPETIDDVLALQAHVKNRKSREQKGNNFAVNSRANASVESKLASRSDEPTVTTSDPPLQVQSGQAGLMLNALDYDDFDLDYQLKVNSSSGNLAESNGVNKRDQQPDGSPKPPSWTSLISQTHVFSPTTEASVQSSNTTSSLYNTAPPIMPALLTVKSTELTSQELNKIRPQLMMYQDNLDSSPMSASMQYPADQSQSLTANGDLLATASAGALPLSSAPTETSNEFQAVSIHNSTAMGQHSDSSVISLINGSPTNRQQQPANLSYVSRPAESSLMTTIVVDSVSPTDLPSTSAPNPTSAPSVVSQTSTTGPPQVGNSTIGGRSTGSRESPSGQAGLSSTSQANQWFNYPHPNLHHNPLLLHHILNNPSMYAQHVANQQNSPSNARPMFPMTSPPSVTTQPSTTTSTSSSSTTTTTTMASPKLSPAPVTQASNIIEKPTLNSQAVGQPSPINRTQLNMQLNEMRALAASSSIQIDQQQLGTLNKSILSASAQPHQQTINRPAWQPSNSLRAQFDPQQPGWTVKQPERDQVEYLSHVLGLSRQFNTQPAPLIQQLEQRLRANAMNPMSAVALPPRLPNALRPAVANGFMQHLLGNPRPSDQQLHQASFNFARPGLTPPIKATQKAPIQPLMSRFPPSRTDIQFAGPTQARIVSSPTPMMAAPSYQQEVFAAKPQAPLQPTYSLPQPTLGLASSASPPPAGQTSRESAELIVNQFGRSSSNLTGPLPMSEEDMSTYVAQLASINAKQPQAPIGDIQAAKGASLESSNIDSALQKLISALEPSASTEQPKSNNGNQAALEAIIKHAKIVGLSEDVQAQLYREHLQPLFGSKPVFNHQPQPAGMASANVPVTKAFNEQDPHQLNYELNHWQRQPNSISTNLNEQTYSSIDGHQEQQKRDKEQQAQREKQIAFIEALRASISRLHNSDLSAHKAHPGGNQVTDEADPLNRGNLTSPGSSADLLAPDQFDEPQPLKNHQPSLARPADSSLHPVLPDWLERQVFQESLIHESARINPFGQTTKTTYIEAPSRQHPSSLPLPPPPPPPLFPVPHRHPHGAIIRLHPAASAPPPSRMALIHHHHFAAPAPLMRPPLLSGSSLPLSLAESNLQPSSVPLLNPTKILADRFPLASAPAYLLKLPTLTGGTITAAGSLTPPFSHLWRNRPLSSMRMLNQAQPGGIKLVSTVAVRPAPSISHPHYLPHPHPHPHPHLHPLPTPSLLAQHAAMHPAPPPAAFLQHPGSLSPPRSMLNNPLDLHLQHLVEQHRGLQALSSSPNVSSLSGVDASSGPLESSRPQSAIGGTNSALQNSAATALNRLQQATASLVELTSLASLVEEMVGGSDLDSSPAVALANAINSLTAAQSGNSPTYLNSTTNDTSSPPSVQQLGQQQMGFSWKNLLNPYIWRDRSPLGAKSAALERLVVNAAARRPPARLKVKYIRVPVAIYETSNGAQTGEIAILPGSRSPLLTKTQLAELIAANAVESAASPGAPTQPILASSIQASPTSSNNNNGNQALLAGGIIQPSSGATSLTQSASSNDLLFDELVADSATPQLALAAMSGIQLANMEASDYLPLFGLKPARPEVQLLKPSESALYYSLVGAPSTGSATVAASPAKQSDNEEKSKKSKKKKKGKDDDDDESEDDEDDDDLLSSGDMPILESIVSTLIHGAPSMPMQMHSTGPMPYFDDLHPSRYQAMHGWRPRHHFGSLRGEASNTVETFANPTSGYLNPLGKYSHRLSLTEMVGALGARKLISNLWGKRKTSRAYKRDVGNRLPEKHKSVGSQSASSKLLNSITSKSRRSPADSLAKTSDRSTREKLIKFPPIVAYDETSVKSKVPARSNAVANHRQLSSNGLKSTNSPGTRIKLNQAAKHAHNNSTTSAPGNSKLLDKSGTNQSIRRPHKGRGTRDKSALERSSSDDTHLSDGLKEQVQYNFYLNTPYRITQRSGDSGPPKSSRQPGSSSWPVGGAQMSMTRYNIIADQHDRFHR